MGWFDEADMEYSVVLTKADRVGRAQQVKCVNEICMRYDSQLAEGYGQQNPVVHVTSARDGLGLNELMIAIDAEFLGYRERDDEVGGES
jgi:GTP-binding protein EngB required for normal cell division